MIFPCPMAEKREDAWWGLRCETPASPCLTRKQMWTSFIHMKTVTVSELRNSFPVLEAWLAEGQVLQVRKRGKPVALLTGCGTSPALSTAKPNFAARRKAIWGRRVFTSDEVSSMRAAE